MDLYFSAIVKQCKPGWSNINNQICVGFSGNSTRFVANATTMCSQKGGKLFNGRYLDATQMSALATAFLRSQKKTSGEWFWIDAYYNQTANKVLWSNSGKHHSKKLPRYLYHLVGCFRRALNIYTILTFSISELSVQ